MTQRDDTINSGLNALFNSKNTQKVQTNEETHSGVSLHSHGRPRKEDSINGKGKYMRTSLILDKKTYDKMRIIAAREGFMLKDVVDSAFLLAIEHYEAKHGPISMEMARISDKQELFK